MSKDLSTILVADGDYVAGKAVDGVTTVGVNINQDMIQFFQKMMDLTGLTPNDLYDNELNDYQFIEALRLMIGEFFSQKDAFTLAVDDYFSVPDNTVGVWVGTGSLTGNSNSMIELFPPSLIYKKSRVSFSITATNPSGNLVFEDGNSNIIYTFELNSITDISKTLYFEFETDGVTWYLVGLNTNTNPKIVDRGDPNTVDFDETDLVVTGFGVYDDIDLSTIIPSWAKFVCLRVSIASDSTSVGDGGSLVFRKNGNSNQINIGGASAFTKIIGVSESGGGDIWVATDANRIIEYSRIDSGNGLSTINVTVALYM